MCAKMRMGESEFECEDAGEGEDRGGVRLQMRTRLTVTMRLRVERNGEIGSFVAGRWGWWWWGGGYDVYSRLDSLAPRILEALIAVAYARGSSELPK